MSEQKLPFTLQDLEALCGSQVYLKVSRKPEPRQSMLEKALDLVRRRTRELQEPKYAGQLYQIKSRVPGAVSCYFIGNVVLVTEDLERLGQGGDLSGTYFFTVEHVHTPSTKPPVLKGIAHPYNLATCESATASQYLNLYLEELPGFKVKGTIRAKGA